MLQKFKSLSEIKRELKNILGDGEILDVILFGSYIKGKALPGDIDVVLITNENKIFDERGYHLSCLSFQDIFVKHHTLFNTLLREGFSVKYNSSFSELYGFKNKCLFFYELSGLTNSSKVKIVNLLRGNKEKKGYVEEKGGAWLANQIFTCPLGADKFFESFFESFKIKYKKSYILIH
jgi:predicted nucleotidyltransferase